MVPCWTCGARKSLPVVTSLAPTTFLSSATRSGPRWGPCTNTRADGPRCAVGWNWWDRGWLCWRSRALLLQGLTPTCGCIAGVAACAAAAPPGSWKPATCLAPSWRVATRAFAAGCARAWPSRAPLCFLAATPAAAKRRCSMPFALPGPRCWTWRGWPTIGAAALEGLVNCPSPLRSSLKTTSPWPCRPSPPTGCSGLRRRVSRWAVAAFRPSCSSRCSKRRWWSCGGRTMSGWTICWLPTVPCHGRS